MRAGCNDRANPDIKNPHGDYLSRRGYPFAVPARYARRERGGNVKKTLCGQGPSRSNQSIRCVTSTW